MNAAIDHFTTRGLSYLYRRFNVDHRRHRTLEIVYERASQESADFILNNLGTAVLFEHRTDYWSFVADSLLSKGILMECGVFQGLSLKFIANRLRRKRDARIIHGFDAFEGLEEHWAGESLPAGSFDLKGKLPTIPANAQLHVGWVQDTVVPFLEKNIVDRVALLHIDTDTYTPAKYLLKVVKPYLKSGSIVAFDELFGYPNWQSHEFKALQEEILLDDYEFIAFTSRQAAIRIR